MITLVLGGARSGKSAVAEALAARGGAPVTYVATMDPSGDPELQVRVDAHRRRRAASWATVDATDDLAGTLARVHGTALVDSLGPWVARFGGGAGAVEARAATLCGVLAMRDGDTVVVSDEVGLAVHPSSAEGRSFRDAIGVLNHAVSAVADKAYFVVAGRALELPPPGPPA